jgi:threonine/homoserine/homoserine lactone efflux protein
MKNHHHHHHHHTDEHSLCGATIIYNVLVVVIEVVILAVFLHSEPGEILEYEWILQGIHLIGTMVLGYMTWRWTHQWAKNHENASTSQQTFAFAKISSIMLLLHIVLLHVVPRLIGFSLHEHNHGGEYVEYAVLGGIILFVTIAFRYRDSFLHKTGLAGRFMIKVSPFIKKFFHYH